MPTWAPRGVGMVIFESACFRQYDGSIFQSGGQSVAEFCPSTVPPPTQEDYSPGHEQETAEQAIQGRSLAPWNFLAPGQPETGISENKFHFASGKRQNRKNIMKLRSGSGPKGWKKKSPGGRLEKVNS